jgi:hypothetical protein
MAVPTSNYGISDIYSEANGGAPSSGSNTAVSDLFKKSYFEGPTGSSTISYNAWGEYGSTSGADRIYGLSAKNTNNAWSDFSGLTYYYDNSTYKVAARIRNSLQAPPFPPFPPTPSNANDIVVEIFLYDSTGTYPYISSGGIAAPAQIGGYDQTTTVSTTTPQNPIIAIGYWKVRITTNQFFPAGGKNVNISLNGTNYVSTTINANGATSYDYVTYGTVNIGSTGQGYTGVYFDIVVS